MTDAGACRRRRKEKGERTGSASWCRYGAASAI